MLCFPQPLFLKHWFGHFCLCWLSIFWNLVYIKQCWNFSRVGFALRVQLSLNLIPPGFYQCILLWLLCMLYDLHIVVFNYTQIQCLTSVPIIVFSVLLSLLIQYFISERIKYINMHILRIHVKLQNFCLIWQHEAKSCWSVAPIKPKTIKICLSGQRLHTYGVKKEKKNKLHTTKCVFQS